MLKKVLFVLSLGFLFFNANAQELEKKYDVVAKTTYSHNDVKAFVYQWFALFDHQASLSALTKHLPKEQLKMHFPDFPINTVKDFTRWYDGVKENIQYNSHELKYLKVKGNEKVGFDVSLIVNWKAKTYTNETYDVDVFQEWKVAVTKERVFIITEHKAFIVK